MRAGTIIDIHIFLEFWVKDIRLHLPESKATHRGLSRIVAWEECKSLVVFAKLWGPI